MIMGFDLANGLDESVIDVVVNSDEMHNEMQDDVLGGLIAAGVDAKTIMIGNFLNSPDRRTEITVGDRVRYVIRKGIK